MLHYVGYCIIKFIHCSIMFFFKRYVACYHLHDCPK